MISFAREKTITAPKPQAIAGEVAVKKIPFLPVATTALFLILPVGMLVLVIIIPFPVVKITATHDKMVAGPLAAETIIPSRVAVTIVTPT